MTIGEVTALATSPVGLRIVETALVLRRDLLAPLLELAIGGLRPMWWAGRGMAEGPLCYLRVAWSGSGTGPDRGWWCDATKTFALASD